MRRTYRSSQRNRAARSEEGAVMLIVLLILLTASALSVTALQTTQFELRSAGYNRSAVQTQYVSEAAASTTLAWVDATAMDRSFLRHLQAWQGAGAPLMTVFGEPEISATNRANANRTQWTQQKFLGNVLMPPLTVPGFAEGSFVDPIGTFGPRESHVPGIVATRTDGAGVTTTVTPNDYVVDMYDCRMLPNTSAVGYRINQGGSGTLQQYQYYCVVTARGRSYVPDIADAVRRKRWTVRAQDGTAVTYEANRFSMSHDARGTIITPPI